MQSNNARIRANAKYNAKAYEDIKIRERKEKRLQALLDIACAKTGKSKNQYLLDAVYAQLDHDGITPDMLPEQEQ